MKQLLFLLLFPCLCMAQYTGNAGQKITLGEQTTADGLVYRGVAADTTRKPSVDTMAYILLDTNTNIIWQYKKATNNAWTRVGGSISSGVTGVLPVGNGGTGASVRTFVDTINTQTVNGAKTFTSAVTATRFNPNSPTISGNSMYLPNTNTLGFTTAGIKRMIITSGGNVGIGTGEADVNVKLDVNGNGFRITGNPPNFYFTNSAVQWKYYLPENSNDFRINDGVSDVLNIIHTFGRVGIGITSPTAVLHLKAGTATASTAPLKFTSGTNLTTAEAGAMEFNGTNLFFSPSTTRHTVNHGLTGSATLNFPSTTTLLSADLTIAVTGAADGDVVSLGVPNAAVNANTSYSAWVSAANTVTVRFNNYSSGTVDPTSALFKVFVTK